MLLCAVQVVAEGPGTPTCSTGVATQPVGNHCSSDELHITQNGTLDSNRLRCQQLSCPQSGPLHNAAWDTRGAHVQDDICVFKLTKSSGLAVKVPYCDESSAPLEVTKISEGALVNSEDKAHNAQDQKPDFRSREMETAGAHAAMVSKAYGANLDHNLEMAFQGLGLSDCLMVPETNIGDINFGSSETMLSEQDLLHTTAIEVYLLHHFSYRIFSVSKTPGLKTRPTLEVAGIKVHSLRIAACIIQHLKIK